MTANTPRLTDDLLRRTLVELAAGPDGEMLLTDVLRNVDARAQISPRLWDTRGWGRAAVLVAAAALLVAATIGATVVLMRPQPTPQPTRTPLPLSTEVIRVPDFFAPFSYRVPEGMSGKLTVHAAPDGFYSVAGADAGSGSLALFFMTGGMHGCAIGERPEPTNDDEVAAFLEAVDEGPVGRTSLGGLPAFTVGIDPAHSACRNSVFHLHGLNVTALEAQLTLSRPGRLIAAATGAGTVGVLISAPTEAALSNWIPVAESLVGGLRFKAPALSDRVLSVSDFAVPFTYRLPVGLGGQLEAHGNAQKVYTIDAHTVGSSGKLEIFPVSGYVHACGTNSTAGTTRPAAFLEALAHRFRAGIGPVTPTTLGNLPAYGANIDPSLGSCPQVSLHLNGLGLSYAESEPLLNSPGRLVLAEVAVRPIGAGAQRNRQTIGVWITAPTEKAFVEWLPIAQALLDGMTFESTSR